MDSSLYCSKSAQAEMVGYVNVYWMLSVLCLSMLPLLLLVGPRRH